jgi:hypothetical protein
MFISQTCSLATLLQWPAVAPAVAGCCPDSSTAHSNAALISCPFAPIAHLHSDPIWLPPPLFPDIRLQTPWPRTGETPSEAQTRTLFPSLHLPPNVMLRRALAGRSKTKSHGSPTMIAHLWLSWWLTIAIVGHEHQGLYPSRPFN